SAPNLTALAARVAVSRSVQAGPRRSPELDWTVVRSGTPKEWDRGPSCPRDDLVMARCGTTHEVCIDHDRGLVVKRFRSWERGEPARDWAALTLLDEFAPGLAPFPVRGHLDGDPPAIVMSWLPGAQLGAAAPLSAAQTDALALALERLWQSVPS